MLREFEPGLHDQRRLLQQRHYVALHLHERQMRRMLTSCTSLAA
jgi:hypothetical protein